MSRFMSQQSDDSDERATPPDLWRPLADAVGGFDLDPASGAEPSPIADTRYTVEDNGLNMPWFGKVFCNPPFSSKTDWFDKAGREIGKGDVDFIVMVSPSATGDSWFHKYLINRGDVICFLGPPRTKYLNTGGSPNFGSALTVFGDPGPEMMDAMAEQGAVWDLRDSHYRRYQQVRFGEQ